MNRRVKTPRRPAAIREAERKAEADAAWRFFNDDEGAVDLPTECTHDTPVGHRCVTCGNIKLAATPADKVVT